MEESYPPRLDRIEIDDKLVAEAMSRDEALAMEGTGWEGDLDELRHGQRPAG